MAHPSRQSSSYSPTSHLEISHNYAKTKTDIANYEMRLSRRNRRECLHHEQKRKEIMKFCAPLFLCSLPSAWLLSCYWSFLCKEIFIHLCFVASCLLHEYESLWFMFIAVDKLQNIISHTVKRKVRELGALFHVLRDTSTTCTHRLLHRPDTKTEKPSSHKQTEVVVNVSL
jgi:hypothetical protein